MHSWWFLKLLVVFLLQILPSHARTVQLVNQQSLASIMIKNQKFNKTAVCTISSGMNTVIGIPGYTFGSMIQDIQDREIPSPFWESALPPPSVITSSQYFPTGVPTYIQRYRKSAHFHYIMIISSDYIKKCDIWRNLSLWLRSLSVTSAECAGLIDQPPQSKG